MRLLLRRDQRSGLMGKVVFTLDVRAELTDDERDHIRRYKLGDTLLYERKPLKDAETELGKLRNALAWRFVNLIVTVKDLASGKRIEARDIVEMLAVEDQIKEAAQTFCQVLRAATLFGGEEVIEI